MKSRNLTFRCLLLKLMVICLAVLCLVLATGEARAGQCVVGQHMTYFVNAVAWTDTIVACRHDAVVHRIAMDSPQLLETWRVDPLRPDLGYMLEPFRPGLVLQGYAPTWVNRSPRRPLVPPYARWLLASVPLLR